MPKLTPETVQICQDLLPYSGSFDEIRLAATFAMGYSGVIVNEHVIYLYSTPEVGSHHNLQVAVYNYGGGGMRVRGTPTDTGGWTDYFHSIAEMLASHEEACREAQRY